MVHGISIASNGICASTFRTNFYNTCSHCIDIGKCVVTADRQPQLLMGPYVRNAFADLNVCLKFEHGLRFKSLYLTFLFAMPVKKGFADECSNSG